jgi:hypothetical protein
VTTVVPLTIASSGPKSTVLIVSDGLPHRTNARLFEVLPLIQAATFEINAAPASTTITLSGELLNGADVSVVAGGITIRQGSNATPNQIAVQIDRLLPAAVPVYAIVDGRRSNTLPSTLDQIAPASALPGDRVTLIGQGLSGRKVVTSFGATTVDLGAQSFSSRITLPVPPGLAAGAVQVKVTIDGRDTNSKPFTVLG